MYADINSANLYVEVQLVKCVFLSKFIFYFSYTLYMSKYIRPGFDLSFTFSLLNGENPANIQAFLSSSDGAFSQQADAIVEVGKK